MDKNYGGHTWVGNMYQKFEAVCQEVDEFVNKETVKYVENHMQTVGESVKNFYSGVVQDILPPFVDPVKHVTQAIPSKQIDLVGTYTKSIVGIKGNTTDIDTNKLSAEDGVLVPTEKCHTPSINGVHHGERIDHPTSEYPVKETDLDLSLQQEGDNPLQETSAKGVQVRPNSDPYNQETFMEEKSPWKVVNSPEHKDSLNTFVHRNLIEETHNYKFSRESSKNHLGNRSSEEEGMPCDIISEHDASVFDNADWGIENIFLKEGFEKVPIVDENNAGSFEKDRSGTLVNDIGIRYSQEESTLRNQPLDVLECGLNTSSTLPSSELESSIVYSENKENEACHVVSSSSETAKLFDLSVSSFTNPLVETGTFYCTPTNSVGCFSVSSHGLSSSESFPALGHDNGDATTGLAFSSYAHSVDSDDGTRTDEAVLGTGLSRSKLDECCNRAQPEASMSCSKFVCSMADAEDLNMETIDLSDKKQLVESCVMVEGERPYTFSCRSGRSRSYKKIIQDAFASRKRLTKEYKQLAIWYGDIDAEFTQPPDETKLEKPPLHDSPDDSEWELL